MVVANTGRQSLNRKEKRKLGNEKKMALESLGGKHVAGRRLQAGSSDIL